MTSTAPELTRPAAVFLIRRGATPAKVEWAYTVDRVGALAAQCGLQMGEIRALAQRWGIGRHGL